MSVRKLIQKKRHVTVTSRDFMMLVDQVMACRTEVRDALTQIKTEVAASERAKQDARASAERARRHEERAQAALAGTMAAEAHAPVVDRPLHPDLAEAAESG